MDMLITLLSFEIFLQYLFNLLETLYIENMVPVENYPGRHPNLLGIFHCPNRAPKGNAYQYADQYQEGEVGKEAQSFTHSLPPIVRSN
jgi:hypothetical protein